MSWSNTRMDVKRKSSKKRTHLQDHLEDHEPEHKSSTALDPWCHQLKMMALNKNHKAQQIYE